MVAGNSTFTGGVTITNGTLSVFGDGYLGNSANSIALNGGVLEARNTFTSARAVTLGGGAFQPDSGDTLTLSGC